MHSICGFCSANAPESIYEYTQAHSVWCVDQRKKPNTFGTTAKGQRLNCAKWLGVRKDFTF